MIQSFTVSAKGMYMNPLFRPLLKILRDRKFGVIITAPITREELEMAGYSFVDDTDQIELSGEETL